MKNTFKIARQTNRQQKTQSRLNVIYNASPCCSHKSKTFCKLLTNAETSIKSLAYASHPMIE